MTIEATVDLPPVHPYMAMDISGALLVRAERFGDRPFLIWEPPNGERAVWTYAAFADEVERVAAGLVSRGVGVGDAVLLFLDNSPAFLLTWFACARVGAVAIDTNTRYSADEVRYAVELTDPVGVVTQEEHLGTVEAASDQLGWIVSTGDGSDGSALWGDVSLLEQRPAEPGAPLCVQFTSGTTSRPKAALFTHANALWGAEMGARHAGYTSTDVSLVCAPLFHTAAMSWLTLATFWAGGAVVVVPKYSASRFWDISLRNGCTSTLALGIMLTTLGSKPVPEHQYRHWTFGAEVPAVKDLFHVELFSAWGMTEVVTNVIINNPDFPSEDRAIGRPAPEYGVRIVDDSGVDVNSGEVGELRILGVRGLSLFAEYLRDPDATARSFDSDGWFRTGDLVRVLPSGAIQFAGRGKDMLKVGGENVAAGEVERVLSGVPGVTAAAVVARKDPILDEVPVGFVTISEAAVASDIPQLAIDRCRELLADFKVPRDVYVLPELPTVILGKIAKAHLTAMANEFALKS
jgi:carnitine-CoA ligase